jgi:nicotinate-nucleotide pyrophosphorylase
MRNARAVTGSTQALPRNLISIGWLTHRAAILDIGLDVEA